MPFYKNYHDTVHWHMADITSRIIAESGIPSDRYHLGKIILQSLKDNPDDLAQIDGSTGESETNSSVLRRSIQCAIGLRKMGFKQGDVMILMAPNHLDLVVPFYAALYLGIIFAPTDRLLGVSELVDSFKVAEPKLVFCQGEKGEDIRKALTVSKLEAKIISFDTGYGDTDFSQLLDLGRDEREVKSFCPENFDPAESIALLISTSGTTGLPKSAAATHKNFVVMGPYFWYTQRSRYVTIKFTGRDSRLRNQEISSYFSNTESEDLSYTTKLRTSREFWSRTVQVPVFDLSLVVAPVQWLSAILNYICAPYIRFTRIQSSMNMTQEHAYEIINKFRPSFMIISPTMLKTLLKPQDRDKCDFTCFEHIRVGGSAIYANLIEELRKITPTTEVSNVYGMSELTNLAFTHGFSSPPESCGKPIGCLEYRLVDTETGKDINEPNVNGELWIKGPGIFKGYYNNPEATAETFAEGDWFKTGDLFYRDDSWSFYFVERFKLLLKYKNHQISPVELEDVIRRHPGVLDVAVTSIPDPECGDLPIACVVSKEGHSPSAQDIKDLVKESLTDSKQLRGGVVFLDKLPTTPTTKVHRRKIKEMVLAMKRE